MPETMERPPKAAGEKSCWLPRRRKSAGLARALLREYLAGLDDGARYAETGALLLSELVANAVQHGRTPADRLILVRFQFSSAQLRIEVHDAGNGRPAVGAAGVEDECGRGLWLVAQLASAWGCCPRAGGVGKTVWCLVPRADQAEG